MRGRALASVPEHPHAGEHHGHAALVGGLDHRLVADGAARLDHRGAARVGGLDLDYMGTQLDTPIKMNPGQSQIYAFFGCSSYSYYNLSYFAAKASKGDPEGTKNVDILTNGVTGSFGTMVDFNVKTIAPILNWSARGTRATWQQIVNSYSERFLTGVNGDE